MCHFINLGVRKGLGKINMNSSKDEARKEGKKEERLKNSASEIWTFHIFINTCVFIH